MFKFIVPLAASLIGVSLAAFQAQARQLYYEIDGQRYSYDTRNRQQVEEARRLIDAANAAAAAIDKAKAEAASNPLARLLGSPAQREARDAHARLRQITREAQENGQVSARSARSATSAPRVSRMARSAQRLENAGVPAERARNAKTTPKADPDAVSAAAPQQATVKSVAFDFTSGIKTIQRADGTIHEEPFDTSSASELDSGLTPNSLQGFVSEVRKPEMPDGTSSLPRSSAQSSR